jgi:hypothetical protein
VGFDLNCVFTLDATLFALYDQVIPGGSGYVLRTSGRGWPDGWVLPVPWELEHGTGGEVAMRPETLRTADLDAWRVAAGVSAEPDPLDAFDDLDHRLGSFLSLAAPVVLISDCTFGGVIAWEHAALFVSGGLQAAYGVDHLENTAFALEGDSFRTVEPAVADSPTTRCAEPLDDRFRGRFLFAGYLPREARRYGPPCRKAWSGPGPSVGPDWLRHFPVLTAG